MFRRTLQFVDVNPLRVYGVGINYTGMGLNLPAPSMTDLQNTFDFARKVWPTGEILTSGFTTLTFSQNLAGNAADGCGSGFNALLGQLKDLRGDTDDLVYGILPTGTPLTGVGGCGGGGAGVGMIGAGATAAHEAGHAVGRQHAPCDDTTRCDSPQNQDGDFPSYGNYVSDSIGEFGFDPLLNVVHDPATRRDFMGYSGNDWISPYTYRALLTKGDPIAYSPAARRHFALMRSAAPDAAAPASGERAEWIRRRAPLLFLSLWVDGDQVTLRPSFTYPAYLRRPGPNSAYEVHLEDKEGKVLACVRLQQSCASCDHRCGPLELQGEVPWDEDALWLVLRRDGKDIERFEIEDAPKLGKIKVTSSKNGDYHISWEAIGAGALQYLLQWQDYDGSWRGVAPRSTETSMLVPASFRYARRKTLKMRLLAVHRLHTASEEFELKAYNGEAPVTVQVTYRPEADLYQAVAVDPLGRALPAQDLVWYDENGGEIGRGAQLALARTSRQGVATVRVLGASIGSAEGFALLDPQAGIEHDCCGCRPSGETALRLMRQANLISDGKEK